jgi:hypothetical protein
VHWGYFPGDIADKAAYDEVKNEWIYTFTSQYIFMSWKEKDRKNCNFTFTVML